VGLDQWVEIGAKTFEKGVLGNHPEQP
jgi:hypothetical protein